MTTRQLDRSLSAGGLAVAFRRLRWLLPLSLIWFCIGFPPAVEAQNAPVMKTPAQIRSDLDRILAQPEFRPTSHAENVLSRALRWIGERWDAFWRAVGKFLDRLFGNSKFDGSKLGATRFGLQWVFIAIFIVLMAWLLALLIRAAIRSWVPRSKHKVTSDRIFDIDEADADSFTEPDAWLQQALLFAEAGDYRRAFRALFLGVLLQLDHAGAIQYHRARTNGDYVGMLRGRGLAPLNEVFRPLVNDFDSRWYGDRQTSEADYVRCRQEYDRIRSLLTSGIGAPLEAKGLIPAPGRA
jgi:hypothetical protein